MSDREFIDDLYGSDSVSSTEELESELYSVLHYNSLSEIPLYIKEKYNIKREGKDEFLISLKKTASSTDLPISKLNGSSPKTSTYGKKFSEVPIELNEQQPLKNSPVVNPLGHVNRVANNEDASANKGSNSFSAKGLGKVDEGLQANVILISDTDSGKDSDVVITETTFDICSISSSSSVECLPGTNTSTSTSYQVPRVSNMILNTIKVDRKPNIFPPAEGKEEEIKIKWREVASPSSWSENMRKYYNRASKRLKYFDCDKIRKEIKDKGTWSINSDDLFPRRDKYTKRCSFCRGSDHLVKNCPKRFSNCSMCGNPGHSATNCPFRMCLNCGEPYGMFVAVCQKCQNEKKKKCDECNQVGHISRNCPDTWRRYHATTSGALNLKPTVLNEKLMCCNCGKRGHLYENCSGLYWSSYPPTSFLVQKNKELEYPTAKRKSLNEHSDLNLNNKRIRWSDQLSYSSSPQYFNSTHMNIRKKKKRQNKPNSPRNNKSKRRSQRSSDINKTI